MLFFLYSSERLSRRQLSFRVATRSANFFGRGTANATSANQRRTARRNLLHATDVLGGGETPTPTSPPGFSSSPKFPRPNISFFLFPIFFGLTAPAIPLRSGLRVFCFPGSSRNLGSLP